MFWQNSFHYPYRLALLIGGGACLLGIPLGSMVGSNPRLIVLLFIAVLTVSCFIWRFEQTALFLLIVRSILDPFSAQGLPGAFALALNGLILLYLTVKLLTKRPIYTDHFWWLFAGWVALQGLWVVLMPLGGLGFGSAHLSYSIREWLRLFSWLMTYLMIMQLRERMPPTKTINILMLAMVIPVGVALLQVLFPGKLPAFLAINPNQVGYRVNGTLGLANSFASFLILFFTVTYWCLNQAQRKLPWLILLGVLLFLLTATKTLIALVMLAVACLVLMIPQFNPVRLFGFVFLFVLTIAIFASSEFGQERLASVAGTPLLNPDIDLSRSILLANYDQNSFNWRLAQWTQLLSTWRTRAPILGFGLGTSPYQGYIFSAPHNDYVRAIFEGGIVGFTTFLSFLGLQVARLIKRMRSPQSSRSQQQFCLSLLAFLLAAMAGMLTDNIWSHTATFMYWFSFLAIAGWDWTESKSSTRRNYEN